MTAQEYAQRCQAHLQMLETEVEDEQLFNVGYIIPQVSLLEEYWHQHGVDESAEVFFNSLKQTVEDAEEQDQVAEQDRIVNHQILDQLGGLLA